MLVCPHLRLYSFLRSYLVWRSSSFFWGVLFRVFSFLGLSSVLGCLHLGGHLYFWEEDKFFIWQGVGDLGCCWNFFSFFSVILLSFSYIFVVVIITERFYSILIQHVLTTPRSTTSLMVQSARIIFFLQLLIFLVHNMTSNFLTFTKYVLALL